MVIGRSPCFEQLYLSLENYVQRGLSQPLLAAESAFPAVDVQPVSGAAPNPARGTPVEPGQESGLGQEPAIAPPQPSPLLHHPP
ncbi:MAG: hypothetical protein HC824_17540 [Synechococcales cyanobacterium RM1_1_8]|nr:hypothetical protein [Synechococcales cyanobacterium RM1_1_8]